jgi:hypothetical protein
MLTLSIVLQLYSSHRSILALLGKHSQAMEFCDAVRKRRLLYFGTLLRRLGKFYRGSGFAGSRPPLNRSIVEIDKNFQEILEDSE